LTFFSKNSIIKYRIIQDNTGYEKLRGEKL